MATLEDLRNVITKYHNEYRKDGLNPIEESSVYGLKMGKELEGVVPQLFWPDDSWPFTNRRGIYAIFSEKQLLYVGKASLQPLGKRLSSYFRYGKEREALTATGHKWTNPPTHIISWAVPEDMSFEAGALEEFVIANLGEELVDNELGKRA